MAQERNEKLYEAYDMRVFSYAMTLTKDRTEAEEITQVHKPGFRGESDEATWLCAIAKRLYLDEKRRQSKSGPMPEEIPDGGRGVEQGAVDRDTSFRIHLALHALEEPYREVFELRIFGELSFRDVGKIFGKTENWARVTYHRAKLKLQERMDEHGL